LTAQLQHPNIIPVHDIGILPETGNHFYTMKLVDGGSLQDVIDELKKQNPDYVRKYNLHTMLSIFKKVCDAVAYAHSKGIIHRDIKPGNIMVGPFGEVLLLDWGLAKYSGSNEEVDIKKKLEETNHDSPLMTMDGIIKGSLAYLSPEQANGDIKEIDHQTDIFLLGGTLYHMLTLEPPYTSKNMVEIIRKAEVANFTHPNDTEFGKRIPEALVNIITKSMAGSKEERFKTVTELSKKVDDYIEGRNVSLLKTFPKGSMLIEDKDLGDETFIIISGKVEISRIIDGKETLLETLERGAVFGELAALTHDIRTAQAKAIEDTQVMVISKQLMFDEIRKLPPWLEKIIFNLASKVSSMNDRIHPFILSNCSLPVLKQLLYLFSIVNSNSENEKTVAIDYEGILHEISQNLGISTSRIEEVLMVLEEFKLAEKDGSDRFCVTNITDLKNLIAYIKREQNITEGMNYSLDEISIQKIPMLDEVYQKMASLHY
ncbi:MAG: serine/threonine-protein kinase, partial [Lentisphaeraceae bacterium]|nr:serine/threonine-protein kinase [Lentisphaeraceae bacterium]